MNIQFVGVDMNCKVVEEVCEVVTVCGLKNVYFGEVDLDTMVGLDIFDGGFDIVYSSGVIYYMINSEVVLK